MITCFGDINPKCCMCGLYSSDLRFTHQQGWSFRWIRATPTLTSIGVREWTCGPCLWLLLSGYKVKGIERIKQNGSL